MKREQLEQVLRASAAITTDLSLMFRSVRALDPATPAVEKLVAWARRRAAEATA